ncbi:hypothetical protein [Hymenobacter cellulosivorans]|uniref:DUF1361 domain-containing protein n=1 Tax=Hymenobacter cellulosivorans TaxID=2932249 RepID=A0ABY4FA97_9BACT|nr:hypothetical protein [Hymenobacter cellulosivorans]UOQ53404.1 hypothetical protein MUN80_01285 [Hymenobacter cellulosivorans]
MFRRILFFTLTSWVLAVAGYYVLRVLLPNGHVFGAWYLMLLYHEAHPLAYITLCCACFGPLAALTLNSWARRGGWGRAGIVALLALATVAVASPLGGMLWYWHDMRAGYFPPDWLPTLLLHGCRDGLALGWLIVALSIPYNVLGLLVCYGLLAAGARRFTGVQPSSQ